MGSCSKAPVFIGDTNTNKVKFAIHEIELALQKSGCNLNSVVQFSIDTLLNKQAYAIQRNGKSIGIIGGDTTALMYGGLQLAELISIKKTIPEFKKPYTESPYIKQRGLKFNIPLDIRTPSYQDAGDAAQNNILEMWNFEFWKEYLDMMARNRYNVLTLWNPHPFPSMIHLEEYPDITLQNVCGTSFPLDTDRTDEPVAKFIAGCGVSKEVMDNLVVLKKISINEKIKFLRKVMRYAKDRGVDVYFITWNIKLNSVAPPGWYREQHTKMGEAGKYGINNDQENPRTIKYLRTAVKEFILTYPDLAGLGLTAGENMENRSDEYDREKWLWSTYGKGVLDTKKEHPGREIKFIHRYWQSGVSTIFDDFISKYPDDINLSFKYARARMYADTAPKWNKEYVEEYAQFGLKSWWNVRNDDIFHFRWGNADYASAFIKNIPPENLSAGYFMGSDGYVWGREFISKHPKKLRELEIDKHWYNFMLWGRMGYNPETSKEIYKGHLANKYPGVDVEILEQTWAMASQIPSMVTKFHWNNWDFQWAVEGCLDLRNGFHTVDRFIYNPTMEGKGILTIPEFVNIQKKQIRTMLTSPLEHVSGLKKLSTQVLSHTEGALNKEGLISNSYDELLYDLRSWAYMGLYYANKIEGAYYLHAYRSGLGEKQQQNAIAALENALNEWKNYAASASRNYNPQFMAKTRIIDWNALIKEVENDIEIAKTSTMVLDN